MKKRNIYFSFLACFAYVVLSSSLPEPQNPPVANTGAPGETTCQQSDCHSGGNFPGSVTIMGVPDTVIAGTTYEVSILCKSDSAIRTGFQATVLNSNQVFTGTFSTIAGQSVNIGRDNKTQRSYARQSAAKFFDANGEVIWKFNWKAPASLPSDSLTFYFAGLMANGNGNKTGDNVKVNKKTFKFQMPVATENSTSSEADVLIYSAGNRLLVAGPDAQLVQLTGLTDLNGRSVVQWNENETPDVSSKFIFPGVYLANYLFRGKPHYQKLFLK